MDPASLALGVVGLTGLFDACLKLYEHVSHARRLTQDSGRHGLFLELEKSRFELVREELLRGLRDPPEAVPVVQGGAFPVRNNDVAPTSVVVWKHDHLSRLLETVQGVLTEAQGIVVKYEQTEPKHKFKKLLPSKRHTKHLSWIADDRNRLKELIDSLRQLNNYLEQVLPAASRQRLHLAFEATVILEADVNQLRDLQTHASTIGYQDLQQGATVRVAKLTLESEMSMAYKGVQDFRIRNHEITFRTMISRSSGVYSTAIYSGSPDRKSISRTVFLERRQLFTTTSSVATAEQRLNHLASVLGSISASDNNSCSSFGIPRCLGWIAPDSSEPDLHFIELIYEYPGRQSESPVSLHTLLQTLSPKQRPSLGTRFHLAVCLARYYAKFLSVGYFHKGMHSHNILFFGDISRPYIVGCAEARAEASPEFSSPLSDTITDRELYLPWETVLTMGERDNSKRARWNAAADVYGLGVMLAEIGHWTCASAALEAASLYDFHQTLLPDMVAGLGFQMGDTFRKVVELCLSTDTSGSTEIDVWRQYSSSILEPLELCRV
ncbi:hypothetical protein BDW74DRAFT_158322 [Aspergillus multicolor]|uniref:uncharacterized protein n=1 Tax=Aspergillus multicolor TaxID=41759 RepID=UPI003CCDA8B4